MDSIHEFILEICITFLKHFIAFNRYIFCELLFEFSLSLEILLLLKLLSFREELTFIYLIEFFNIILLKSTLFLLSELIFE